MYLIYSDESGTARNQPVTVVAAVIMDPDKHWRLAEDMLRYSIETYVPPDLQAGFVFHAADIWNGYRDRRDWAPETRQQLITFVASIPRAHGMALAFGKVRRDSPVPHDITRAQRADFNHQMAFWTCMLRANKFISENSGPEVVAMLVVEDIPEKRAKLKSILRIAPPQNHGLNPSHIQLTKDEIARGVTTQTPLSTPPDRIVDTVHFLNKHEGPLLQIADACAYSFRRFVSGERNGDELARRMVGFDLVYDDWTGPTSNAFFSFKATISL